MKIVVLGAGVVGTASAWYLARAGHEVLVVDRQAAPALETSFANGGQISVSHSEPWANPTAPIKVLKWLGREDAPLLFRLRADPDQWLWGIRFLVECLPSRARRNTEAAFALALYSREQLRELRNETGIAYAREARGILHLYEDSREFAHAHAEVALLQSHGFKLDLKTPEECVAVEPALKDATVRIAGGVYATSDESGDAHLFTENLSALCKARGVAFRFNVSVKRVEVTRERIERVVIDDEQGVEESLRADAYVVALGSYSAPLLRPIGVAAPIYPVKGYSITLPLKSGARAPQVSLTDHARKIVFSRLGDQLRVAGTAELNGFNTEINASRCDALLRRCFEWFPNVGNADEAQSWTGLRPATPSNLPLIGRSGYANLFLNTGHGTLGWTMACGSGRALADIVDGHRPEPDFQFLGMKATGK